MLFIDVSVLVIDCFCHPWPDRIVIPASEPESIFIILIIFSIDLWGVGPKPDQVFCLQLQKTWNKKAALAAGSHYIFVDIRFFSFVFCKVCDKADVSDVMKWELSLRSLPVIPDLIVLSFRTWCGIHLKKYVNVVFFIHVTYGASAPYPTKSFFSG